MRENGLLVQICGLALSCYTDMHPAVCSRYIGTPRAPPQFYTNWDLLCYNNLFCHISGSDLGQILQALDSGDHIVFRMVTAPGWCVTSRLRFGLNTWKYLLASALTLSISPSRVTSLSIKLKKKRKERVSEMMGVTFSTQLKIRRNMSVDFALRLWNNFETKQHHWLIMQKQEVQHN